MKTGIIFDMDGTLWDSSEGVAESWTETVKKELPGERVITVKEIQGVMGKTMDVIAEILFPELSKEGQLDILEKCCKTENDYLREHGGVLYPKLAETLEELKKYYHLYIVSNCQSGYIEAFLDHYGFWNYFEDILCFGDNGFKKGANIKNMMDRNQLDKAYYVGDIQGDFDASEEAGSIFVHAAYGFGSINKKTLRIEQFEDLVSLMKKEN